MSAETISKIDQFVEWGSDAVLSFLEVDTKNLRWSGDDLQLGANGESYSSRADQFPPWHEPVVKVKYSVRIVRTQCSMG